MLNITRQQAFLLALLVLFFVFAVLIGFMLLIYQDTASAPDTQYWAVRCFQVLQL